MELLKQEGYVGRIVYIPPTSPKEQTYFIARTTKASGMTPYIGRGVVEKKLKAMCVDLEDDGGIWNPACIVKSAEVLKIDYAVLESHEIKP
jgi:hypothetical protein